MKEKPFISIIIPAYNAETTLKRCVRSVLIQDYEEYEIIVVDDGSKDETSAICDWYEKKYKAVQVIHSENKGVSSARNLGLEKPWVIIFYFWMRMINWFQMH